MDDCLFRDHDYVPRIEFGTEKIDHEMFDKIPGLPYNLHPSFNADYETEQYLQREKEASKKLEKFQISNKRKYDRR